MRLVGMLCQPTHPIPLASHRVSWLLGYEFWIVPNLWSDDASIFELFTPLYTFDAGAEGRRWHRIGAVSRPYEPWLLDGLRRKRLPVVECRLPCSWLWARGCSRSPWWTLTRS